MDNRTRITNTILGLPVDHAPYTMYLGLWQETLDRWKAEGLSGDWFSQCGFEPGLRSACSFWEKDCVQIGMWPFYQSEVLQDNGRTVVFRDQFGIVKEDLKAGGSFPRFLSHPVKTPEDWEKVKAERFNPNDRTRFPEGFGTLVRELNAGEWFVQLGDYPWGLFGTLRELMGVENCLTAFYDMPDTVHDIMDHLTDLWITLYDKIVNRWKLKVDCIHIWEDMSGVNGPLISPAMVEEYMLPGYRRLKAFCRDSGIPVFSVDSDGDVTRLVRPFLSAGINFMWPFEAVAGSNVRRYLREYPELACMGGIDKRKIALGKKAIDGEIELVKEALAIGRYIPALDHAAHPEISWPDFQYFCGKLRDALSIR